jgi:hypothetical protein
MKYLVGGLAISAALLAGACNCPRAHADDPDPNPAVVCGMYDAGVPPGQIPDDLRRNDARVNSPYLPYKVFQDLQNC